MSTRSDRWERGRAVVAEVRFGGDRTLYGVWSPWHAVLSAPLFKTQADAAKNLDCGISRLVDEKDAMSTSEEVVVYLISATEGEAAVLRTQASWTAAYVTGVCESQTAS